MVDDEGGSGRREMTAQGKMRLVAVAVCLSLAAGCTTTGGGKSSRSTVFINALQGGIVTRSGVQLSSSDRLRALEAEYRALEAAPGGQPVAWQGGSVSGQVVAAAPYQVGQQNCRQYTHKLNVDGRAAEARGAACRNSDGTWTPLT